MAKQTSFSHQRSVLEKFSHILDSFDQDMKQLIQHYESNVYSLYEEQGLMEEIYQDYKSACMDPMKTKFEEISQRLYSEDIPFVEREIDFISSR